MNDQLLRQCLAKLYEVESTLRRPKLSNWEFGFLDNILHQVTWSRKQRAIAARILSKKGAWIIPRRLAKEEPLLVPPDRPVGPRYGTPAGKSLHANPAAERTPDILQT